ncbi:MAG: hypothetical protein ABR540_02875 [Acidimicrobiales bacterium]
MVAAAACLLASVATLAPRPALAQEIDGGASIPGPITVLQAGPTPANTYIPPPPSATVKAFGAAAAAATFEATYTSFSPEAQTAFQRALDIWGGLISSPVPIKVSASLLPMAAGTLAQAGTDHRANFPGAPVPNTLYPISLANTLAGHDLDPEGSGMGISFNSNVNSWYFGTDGRPPPGAFDFVSVALHEIGHGLGFEGFMRVSGGTASWGIEEPRRPGIYDRFTTDANRVSLLDPTVYPNFSAALASALTSDNVYFDSGLTNSSDGTGRPKLHAPSSWVSGSSYGHLDEFTYAPGNPNSLMTPILARDETIHSPGPAVLCILEAIGWSTAQACPAGVSSSATIVSSTSAEPGDAITASATGVGAANSSYGLRMGSTVFNCPTGLALGGVRNSDASFNIQPVQRFIPTNSTSGNRWLCWVRTGNPGDWSTPIRITIV